MFYSSSSSIIPSSASGPKKKKKKLPLVRTDPTIDNIIPETYCFEKDFKIHPCSNSGMRNKSVGETNL